MKWDTSIHESEPLTDELIEGFEKITGFKLPTDYRNCVKKYPNAYPKPDSLKIDLEGEEWIVGFGVLMTLDPFFEYENVLGTLAAIRHAESCPKYLLPFAVGGGGDYLCFDYSKSVDNPTIVYYYHELAFSEGIFYVAANFTDLVDSLFQNDDEDEDFDDF